MAANEAAATASSGAPKNDKTTTSAISATTATNTLSSDQQRPVGDGDEVLPDADADEQGPGDGIASQTQPDAQGQNAQSQTQPPPPPGPRASRLQALFASSLDHTLAKISWDNFAACYPTAAAKAPQALRTVHRAMVDRLGELCAAEFAVVMRNRDVVRRLNELETLSVDAQKRRLAATATATASGDRGTGTGTGSPPPPPHTLPAETVLAAHLTPQRTAQRKLLEERLAAVQAANTARFARLTAQQAEAAQLVEALERALADAEGAAALLDGASENGHDDGVDNTLVAELARETRAAEVEMSGI
ncbi:mind kinetochore complex component [Sporothrix brasiliensis 5110]|uniref:Mind kinetochore complex component n=1 Tax=Sporothrix brasiliensis 5110 TaxID=1398154 RepID=A0A0C2IG46_9PEZI|nr:mind kinetochore complex component [Sporothrix brasiliensis 5110]KIH88141.1 mind kinetochore complex component [Sporothrix brasiliensis 5110]